MTIVQLDFPTTIFFGPGARHRIASYLAANRIERPLVVTDKGIVTLPIFKEFMEKVLGDSVNPAVYSNIYGNPVPAHVEGGVASYRAHAADGIIGFGGGAALDIAKAIALMLEHPGEVFDYDDLKVDARPVDRPIPFWIAVPTTAGTGSEIGRTFVVSHPETRVKKLMYSPRLMARAVFADPELTLGLPPRVTATTGMDALTHCVEAYLAKNYHPFCDGVALEGTRLAAQNLARAVNSPSDLEARSGMLMASLMGAVAFQKGLGVTHSCAHALSAVCDLHHGLANGLMITYALKHNVTAVPGRFTILSSTLGLKEKNANEFLRWLQELKVMLGIPRTLKEAGIRREQLPRLVEVATGDICHLNNPRPCTKEDFARIFMEAFS
jgi:alcohol dehydrogenase class IV